MHQAVAKLKYAKLSAQKARLIADQIRGCSAEKASELLRFSPKKAAKLVKKVLDSAIANAENNYGLDIDELYINSIMVDEGPTAKRYRARARGRVNYIFKRSCHITVQVASA